MKYCQKVKICGSGEKKNDNLFDNGGCGAIQPSKYNNKLRKDYSISAEWKYESGETPINMVQDLNAEIDAQRDIARLGYEEARLMEAKATLEVMPKETPKAEINLSRNQEPVFKADPKAEAWGAKNKWFGQDTAMTYTAFDIHKKLVDEEDFDPASDEYYAEIDKRIRLEFPHKFANNATTETTKPTQVVASAKRSVKPGRKTVRLTPSQVAIAKKLGVPLEEYAKQLNITKEV